MSVKKGSCIDSIAKITINLAEAQVLLRDRDGIFAIGIDKQIFW